MKIDEWKYLRFGEIDVDLISNTAEKFSLMAKEVARNLPPDSSAVQKL
jgi:hypothetical protein